MVQIFGDFIENDEYREDFSLGFSPSSLPLQNRWRNNGISADYIAEFLTSAFPSDVDNSTTKNELIEIKSAVNYIANELLENAMKYCDQQASYPVTFQVQLVANEIRLFLKNSIIPSTAERFQTFIQELLTSNPEELYIQQLEKSVEQENPTSSGLGFISMMTDYSARLGWKFQTLEENPVVMTVTTMVRLGLEGSEPTVVQNPDYYLEIKGEGYHIHYDGNSRTIHLRGKIRLRGMEEYTKIITFLDRILQEEDQILTLDIRNLELLNSSGINMLSKFFISIRKQKNSEVSIIASQSMMWQVKLVKNLKRLIPKLSFDFR